ncbi:MAG: 2-phosphosulfolactate phosphatase [Negativicutes bacterium]|nr:2-phosphosulfolactate phosphatase [Negativicutes bacterium]
MFRAHAAALLVCRGRVVLMNIHVCFLPSEARGVDLANTVSIVLDIFRATTCITAAMANGCVAIYPVLTVEDALQIAAKNPGFLLAGERLSIQIEGFNLGNSPYDFRPENVQGRQVIMTTTNGTAAIRATEGSYRTFIGSFLNAAALCRQAARYGKDLLIICAGTEQLFSLEDALCAGYLVTLLQCEAPAAELTDAAQAAMLLYLQAQDDLISVAKNGKNGKRLYRLNRASDIEYCLRKNCVNVVPSYHSGSIRL